MPFLTNQNGNTQIKKRTYWYQEENVSIENISFNIKKAFILLLN